MFNDNLWGYIFLPKWLSRFSICFVFSKRIPLNVILPNILLSGDMSSPYGGTHCAKSSIYRVYIESSFPSIMSLFDSCAAVAADGRWMAR